MLGAVDGGAGEVLVIDGHRSGDNFIAERLPEGARYVMGRGRPHPLDGLDGTFDGVILLGYHSMAGTPNGLLAHTMSAATWKRFSVSGITLGEIGMMALIAGSHGVPVWLVTGGRCACEEAVALLGPDLPTLAVKEDIAHESSITVAPAEARHMIRKAVARGRRGAAVGCGRSSSIRRGRPPWSSPAASSRTGRRSPRACGSTT